MDWKHEQIQSPLELCRDFDLDWDQKPIKILGETFYSRSFFYYYYYLFIFGSTYPTKKETILAVWSKRKLTFQRNIIVKINSFVSICPSILIII